MLPAKLVYFKLPGTFQEADVIRRAYELNYLGANNVPVLNGGSGTVPNSWVIPEHPAVVVEAFKPAHDVVGSIVIRLYESHGGGATSK